jgi:hypothetical protein
MAFHSHLVHVHHPSQKLRPDRVWLTSVLALVHQIATIHAHYKTVTDHNPSLVELATVRNGGTPEEKWS